MLRYIYFICELFAAGGSH